MEVKLLVDGGKMQPGPAVAQQLGPLGINLGQLITDVNTATKGFSGMKVPVVLEVDPDTKAVEISVSSPPVSELVKKELKLEKGSGEPHKYKVGNLAIEQVIGIAKTKLPNLLDKTLKAAVKTVVGTCVSLGVLIESKSAADTEKAIDKGDFDKEIKAEKTEVDPAKQAALDKDFKKITKAQEKQRAEEEAAEAEAAAAKEAAKAAEAAEGAEGEAPAEGAEAPAAEEKKE